jgi:hypothetical protein
MYAMEELEVPFEERTLSSAIQLKAGTEDIPHSAIDIPGMGKTVLRDVPMYTLRVCKDCRADWMSAIQGWWKERPERKSTGTGVFIRENGATRELTEAEIAERFPHGNYVKVVEEDT